MTHDHEPPKLPRELKISDLDPTIAFFSAYAGENVMKKLLEFLSKHRSDLDQFGIKKIALSGQDRAFDLETNQWDDGFELPKTKIEEATYQDFSERIQTRLAKEITIPENTLPGANFYVNIELLEVQYNNLNRPKEEKIYKPLLYVDIVLNNGGSIPLYEEWLIAGDDKREILFDMDGQFSEMLNKIKDHPLVIAMSNQK